MNINYTNFFMESLPTLFRFIDACPIVDTVVFQSGVLIVFNEIGTLSHHLQGLIHLRYQQGGEAAHPKDSHTV